MIEANSYKDFASVYDCAIDPSVSFLSFLDKALKKKKRLKVLDLGCGTGKYTIPLAKKGFNISGVDASKEMLAVAKKKASESGKKIRFFKGDAKNLELKEKFGAIVSCDCINHFIEEEALLKVFESVFNNLDEKGKFIFQTYTQRYVESIVLDPPYGGRVGENFFVWENRVYGSLLDIQLSIFIKKEKNKFEKISGTVLQKAYPLSVIKKNLKKAGFGSVKAFGASHKKAGKSDQEWYLVAEK